MKEITTLTCATCDADLNDAFVGKANARGWSEDSIFCSIDCSHDADSHILPEA